MTAPRIEEKTDWIKKWQAKYEIHPTDLAEIYDDLYPQAHQAGIDEAVRILKSKRIDGTQRPMTNQPDSVEKLWNKYRHEGDENTPDRMFYENFVDAITEAIAEAEEDIDLLTEEMARLREDVENARAEERERCIAIIGNLASIKPTPEQLFTKIIYAINNPSLQEAKDNK